MNDYSSTKDVPITKETVVDRSFETPLGPVWLNMPGGQVQCHDAASMTLIEGEHLIHGHFVAVAVAVEHDGKLLGAIMPLNPVSARSFAASLVGGADKIDGGQVTN